MQRTHQRPVRASHRAARAVAATTLGGMLALSPLAVHAADFNVAAGDVAGLAAAIVAANANTDCINHIRLPAGTWTIAAPWSGTDAADKTGLPAVLFGAAASQCGQTPSRRLEITGAGMDTTIIQRAAGAPRFRFFSVSPGGNAPSEGLRLTGLTLRGGDLFPATPGEFYGDGGAIDTDASTVALDQVRLSGHRATQGGAIHMRMSHLFVNRSVVEGNSAARQGGAFYGQGILQIQASSLSNNSAGAIAVSDASSGGGGAINWRFDGASTISDSTLANNRVLNNLRSGGAIYSDSPGSGGAPVLQIVRSELRGNRATGSGGALSLGHSVFLDSSTLSANTAAVQAAAIEAADVFLQNVTLMNNAAPAGGSAIHAQHLLLRNTLLAATLAGPGTGTASHCAASITEVRSAGYNLDSDGSCRLAGLGDLSIFDPASVLDPVARNNGGTSLTHALVAGGLAVDRGDPVSCRVGNDQRGGAGLQDGNADGLARCDIGAFELNPPMLLLSPLADAYVRSDLDVRRNDNYGLQDFLEIGNGRGGGGQAYGAADQMRTLLRFDLSFVAGVRLSAATLQTTVHSFDGDASTTQLNLDVHALQASTPPWSEGNGFEGSRPAGAPAALTDPDGAAGVAWAGAADNTDPAAANNTSQPAFEPAALARQAVAREPAVYPTTLPGDVLQWDISSAAQRWINGSLANNGLVLRDTSADAQFRGIRLGSREGPLYRLPAWVAAPRLVLSWTPGTAAGDLSGDTCVDRKDLALLMAVIRGQAVAGRGLAPKLDLNQDGKVDVADARKLTTLFTLPLGVPCR